MTPRYPSHVHPGLGVILSGCLEKNATRGRYIARVFLFDEAFTHTPCSSASGGLSTSSYAIKPARVVPEANLVMLLEKKEQEREFD